MHKLGVHLNIHITAKNGIAMHHLWATENLKGGLYLYNLHFDQLLMYYVPDEYLAGTDWLVAVFWKLVDFLASSPFLFSL